MRHGEKVEYIKEKAKEEEEYKKKTISIEPFLVNANFTVLGVLKWGSFK